MPVVRAPGAREAGSIAARLVDARAGAIELTTTIPGWADLLADLGGAAGETMIGMGTVVTAADAETALERGARFLVSPYPAPEVRPVADAAGALFVEGGMTPGEVAQAARHGAAKLFPAHVGGLQYLRSLLAVMPGARIVPTGGIAVRDVPEWLAAGALAVGVGSDLYGAEDIDEKLAELREATAGAAT
ncbi:MAG: 2-dehydro-3-deoxyphosphogluconate aldolase / (4S)-4-hydroxy-2-oxoglutarate aldolase [Solirubrobacteraceae bacterium]|nr:2-dehydro-3-deoxyphosphogluconate aldolase / (4S)-4-hydroxy-2-oxoglutarate aldolase [Solirubrobacteraceae bacterium]